MGPPGCSESQILVGLRWLAKAAAISGHGHEVARGHIRRSSPRGKMNADRARKLAVEAAREADRAEAHAVPAYGRLRWTGSALADHRAMSEWGNGWLEVSAAAGKRRPAFPREGVVGRQRHSESSANLLMSLRLNSAPFSEYPLKSLMVLLDFDSPMRRFESSRPSQAVRRLEILP